VADEALEPLGDRVRIAFVFGSVAQGKERGTSDVDVMVLGSVGFERVVREPKLFIKGGAGELGEPAPERATQAASR
jgi:predicted nucleotidyltransferase